ncbi:hypothetical protein Vafri_6101 [Volvox africanus]|uniref:Uncharacterized protein n=1 Tax=Volvox africanus TaxID=51714 RepID=A0A8J4EVR4_9CHLO|nr:hypothetical protein Vafri_6101 [Volvox africanus]
MPSPLPIALRSGPAPQARPLSAPVPTRWQAPAGASASTVVADGPLRSGPLAIAPKPQAGSGRRLSLAPPPALAVPAPVVWHCERCHRCVAGPAAPPACETADAVTTAAYSRETSSC